MMGNEVADKIEVELFLVLHAFFMFYYLLTIKKYNNVIYLLRFCLTSDCYYNWRSDVRHDKNNKIFIKNLTLQLVGFLLSFPIL